MSEVALAGKPAVRCLTVRGTDKAESLHELDALLKFWLAYIVTEDLKDGAVEATIHMACIADPVLVLGIVKDAGYDVIVHCHFHLPDHPHVTPARPRKPRLTRLLDMLSHRAPLA